MPKSRGFTLIELMMVISIIAILSSVGLVIFANAKKSGRTAKRIQDLNAIQTSLELYFNANNKTYPQSTGSWWQSQCAGGVGGANNWGSLQPAQVIPGLTPDYLETMPADPSMNSTQPIINCYVYRSDGVDYKLVDLYISDFGQPDYQGQKKLIDPARDGGPDGNGTPTSCNGDGDGSNLSAWAIYSDGARCWL